MSVTAKNKTIWLPQQEHSRYIHTKPIPRLNPMKKKKTRNQPGGQRGRFGKLVRVFPTLGHLTSKGAPTRCSKNLKPQTILCDILGSESTRGVFPLAE